MLGFVLAVMLLGAAAFILWRALHVITFANLAAAVGATPVWRLGAAFGFTAISFAALASYDVIAARLIAPARLPTLVAAAAGAAANAIANTLGFHAVTATAVRVRIFQHWGIRITEVAQIIALSWAALALCFVAVLALSLMAAPSGSLLSQAGGAGLECALAILLIWMARGSRSIEFGRLRVSLPSGWLAVAQAAIGTIETAATMAALYVLIPPGIAPPFATFAAAFIAAVLLGIVSHAPGGVGVFEAAMLSIFPAGHAPFLAALLLFRLIYNLLPFVVAVSGFLIFELRGRKRAASSMADIAE